MFIWRIQIIFNLFVPNASFLYPLKTSENLKVFWCFQGVEKGCIRNKWVNFWENKCIVSETFGIGKQSVMYIRKRMGLKLIPEVPLFWWETTRWLIIEDNSLVPVSEKWVYYTVIFSREAKTWRDLHARPCQMVLTHLEKYLLLQENDLHQMIWRCHM